MARCSFCLGNKGRSPRDTTVVWGDAFGTPKEEIERAIKAIQCSSDLYGIPFPLPEGDFNLCDKCSKEYFKKRRQCDTLKKWIHEGHKVRGSGPQTPTPTPKRRGRAMVKPAILSIPRRSMSSSNSSVISNSSGSLYTPTGCLEGRALTHLHETLDKREAAAGRGSAVRSRSTHGSESRAERSRRRGKGNRSPGPPILQRQDQHNTEGSSTSAWVANTTPTKILFSGKFKNGNIDKLIDESDDGNQREIDPTGQDVEDAANTSILRSGRRISKVVVALPFKTPGARMGRKSCPNPSKTGIPRSIQDSDTDDPHNITWDGGDLHLHRKRRRMSSIETIDMNNTFDTSAMSSHGRKCNTKYPQFYSRPQPQEQTGQENNFSVAGSSTSSYSRGRGLTGLDSQINMNSSDGMTGSNAKTAVSVPMIDTATAPSFGFIPPALPEYSCHLCKLTFGSFNAKKEHGYGSSCKAWLEIPKEDRTKKTSTAANAKQKEFTHKCGTCGKSYQTEGQLKVHKQENHNEDGTWIPCEICATSYTFFFAENQVNLGEHQRRLHKKKILGDDD